MPQIFLKRARKLVLLGLLVPCLLISIPAFLAFRAQRQVEESVRWVTHTLNVQNKLQRLISALVDAEGGFRGFLLTSRETYLEPYHWGLTRIPHELKALEELTVDNTVQQANLGRLESLVTTHLASLAEGLALFTGGKRDEAFAYVATDKGKNTTDAIRALVWQMDEQEESLLALRQNALSSHNRFNTILLFGIVGLNFVFVGGLLFTLRRISKLEDLVTICAWSRTVEFEGEWISFEAYLQRRFNLNTSHGISPAEAEKVFGELRSESQRVNE